VTRPTPDAEAIVIARFLNDRTVSDLVDDRVGPVLPPDAVFPFLTVSQATDEVVGWGTVAAAVLDIQAWGNVPTPNDSGKEAVSILARTARASLWDRGWVGVQAVGGVVSGVSERVGIQWLPDPETNRPRYIFQIVLHAHPDPTA
jgi:hypothetical protein